MKKHLMMQVKLLNVIHPKKMDIIYEVYKKFINQGLI